MAYEQPILSTEQKTEITDYINSFRTKHQSPPLVWDDQIATFSQNWSYYLIMNNLFEHSGSSIYGENLAYFQGYGTDTITLLKKAIDNWYNEITLYDFKNPGFSSKTGHFTCLVWKSSTKFGMGISINTDTNTVDITMNTSPTGNILGEFEQNVLPEITQTIPVPTIQNYNQIKSDLYKLVYLIQTNQPILVLSNKIKAIEYEINATNIINKKDILTTLEYVIFLLKRRQNRTNILTIINNIINNIK